MGVAGAARRAEMAGMRGQLSRAPPGMLRLLLAASREEGVDEVAVGEDGAVDGEGKGVEVACGQPSADREGRAAVMHVRAVGGLSSGRVAVCAHKCVAGGAACAPGSLGAGGIARPCFVSKGRACAFLPGCCLTSTPDGANLQGSNGRAAWFMGETCKTWCHILGGAETRCDSGGSLCAPPSPAE